MNINIKISLKIDNLQKISYSTTDNIGSPDKNMSLFDINPC